MLSCRGFEVKRLLPGFAGRHISTCLLTGPLRPVCEVSDFVNSHIGRCQGDNVTFYIMGSGLHDVVLETGSSKLPISDAHDLPCMRMHVVQHALLRRIPCPRA